MSYASGENMFFLQLYFVKRSSSLYIIINEEWPDRNKLLLPSLYLKSLPLFNR